MDNEVQQPAIVRWTLKLEEAAVLDRPVHSLEPPVHAIFGSGTRGAVLRGQWLGHALHPTLTDLVLGTWTSATLLDLFGGREWAAPAQHLIGTGLVAAGPRPGPAGRMVPSRTSRQTSRPGPCGHQRGGHRRVRRVVARSPQGPARDRGTARPARSHRLGCRRLPGGHLAAARKVASHHPRYDKSPAST